MSMAIQYGAGALVKCKFGNLDSVLGPRPKTTSSICYPQKSICSFVAVQHFFLL